MKSRRDERFLRILDNDERVRARFWTRVRKGESEFGCWQWTGPVSKRHPSFQIGAESIAAARITWWSATGAFPTGGRFFRTCRNEHCVRPDHLAWQLGRTAQSTLRLAGEPTPSGIPMRVAVAEGDRPQEMRFVSREAAAPFRIAG